LQLLVGEKRVNPVGYLVSVGVEKDRFGLDYRVAQLKKLQGLQDFKYS